MIPHNLYRILIKYFLYLLIILMSACHNHYPEMKPLSVQKGAIIFEGVNKEQINTIFIFSIPEKYDPHKSWPLLMTLHGSGSNASAFLDLFKPVTDSLGLVLVALQGESRSEEGFGWRWGINTERALLTCLDIVQKQINVDRYHLYLLGFSSGGRVAYEIGIKHSTLFKGIALLSAPIDSIHFFHPASQLKHMRIFIARGEYEKKYMTETQHLVQQLTGRCEALEYKIFEKTGHGLPEPKEEAIKEILDFLLTQRFTALSAVCHFHL
jgi:predicted esterase